MFISIGSLIALIALAYLYYSDIKKKAVAMDNANDRLINETIEKLARISSNLDDAEWAEDFEEAKALIKKTNSEVLDLLTTFERVKS